MLIGFIPLVGGVIAALRKIEPGAPFLVAGKVGRIEDTRVGCGFTGHTEPQMAGRRLVLFRQRPRRVSGRRSVDRDRRKRDAVEPKVIRPPDRVADFPQRCFGQAQPAQGSCDLRGVLTGADCRVEGTWEGGRHSEVDELRGARGGDENVSRLEIAVHHRVLVRVGHRLEHREHQGEALRGREPVAIAVLIDGLAVDELHHEVRSAFVGFTGVEQVPDVRMLEAGEDLALVNEALGPLGHVALRFVEDLHRDLAPKLRIPRGVDDAHASGADSTYRPSVRGAGRSSVVRASSETTTRQVVHPARCALIALTCSVGKRPSTHAASASSLMQVLTRSDLSHEGGCMPLQTRRPG